MIRDVLTALALVALGLLWLYSTIPGPGDPSPGEQFIGAPTMRWAEQGWMCPKEVVP